MMCLDGCCQPENCECKPYVGEIDGGDYANALADPNVQEVLRQARANQHELWLEKYQPDAYVDQTGMVHNGKVVLERVVVIETRREPAENPYTKQIEPEGRIIALEPETGRRFTANRNFASGCYEWVTDNWQPGNGMWREAHPNYVQGYVLPDGTPLLDIVRPEESPNV